ncbi:hypothetical protein AZ09_04305 [Acetobacter aceti 1023]|nr:hypothetical protein AZ09_04305 [Acetobacter aceti 1023]
MQPPASISWLVNAVGEDAALLFIESAGGQRIMVPRNAPGSLLSDLYGAELAAELVNHHGGSSYQVPLVKTWRAHVLARRGLSNNEIASRLGISWRQVSNLLQSDPSLDRKVGRGINPNQMDMFGI